MSVLEAGEESQGIEPAFDPPNGVREDFPTPSLYPFSGGGTRKAALRSGFSCVRSVVALRTLSGDLFGLAPAEGLKIAFDQFEVLGDQLGLPTDERAVRQSLQITQLFTQGSAIAAAQIETFLDRLAGVRTGQSVVETTVILVAELGALLLEGKILLHEELSLC